MEICPIAHIHTNFKEKFGIPRQSCLSESSVGRIVFEPQYRDPEAFREIESFSYIWLIFDFSESHRSGWSSTVRPPRLGGNTRVGVFASRSPFRPNSLGLSSVKLLSLDMTEEGPVLVVGGADLLDGTPIYDIKPYIRYSDSHPDAESGFGDRMFSHSLNVTDPGNILAIIPNPEREELISCLSQDPRPSYQDDDRTYWMRFSDYDVSFVVKDNDLVLRSIKDVKAYSKP